MENNSPSTEKVIAGMNLFLTRQCNLRCSYCFVDKSKARNISREVCDSSIAFIETCADKNPKKMHIGYIGGEPLVNWDGFQYVTSRLRGSKHEFDIGFTTNGTLLDQEKIAFISKNNLRVVLSFDGDITAMNDRLMADGQSSYPFVKSAVEKLLQAEYPFFVQLTITPYNAKELEKNILHLANLGIRKMIFGFTLEVPWDPQSLADLQDNMAKVFSLYKQVYRAGSDLTLKYISDEILSYFLVKANKPRISQACPLGNEVFAIDVDGSIYPCQALVNYPEWQIGDVQKGFSQIPRSLISSIRNDSITPCASCVLKAFCRKCPRSNYLINGDPFLMEGISCFLGRTTFALVDDFVHTMYRENNARFLNEFGSLLEEWCITL